MFQVDDIVKLRGGSAHQRVTRIERGGRISTKYLDSSYSQINRRASDFELVSTTEPKKSKPKARPMEDQTMTQKLYKVKNSDPEVYGSFLTENSQGKVVLEIRGTCEVKSYDPEEIEEVVPYTAKIEFANGQKHHYAVPAGRLQKDDIVVMGIHLGRVIDVDTKQRSHRKPEADLRKVGTVAISV